MTVLTVLGAYVATTASTRAVSYVSQFNPDHIINYTEMNWWDVDQTGQGDFDFILICGKEEGVFEHAKSEGLVKFGMLFAPLF